MSLFWGVSVKFFVYFVSLFASIIHFEICVMGMPVFSARCLGERFAKSDSVFTPANSSSIALLVPIPFISVKFDPVSDF